MNSLNKVQIIGNVGADPEVRRTQGGDAIVNMRVACSETWKNAEGERKERTEWITVVIFNPGLAKVAEQFVHKGTRVYIEGQLQTRKWQDQSGTDRYSTEVVLQKYRGQLLLLSGKPDDGVEAKPVIHGGDGTAPNDEIPF
jgi:single-strand DNA-binding protein